MAAVPLLTTKAVAAYLDISPRTLLAMADTSPSQAPPPRLMVGAGTRRPEYRWRSLAEVDRWLEARAAVLQPPPVDTAAPARKKAQAKPPQSAQPERKTLKQTLADIRKARDES